MLSQLPGHPLAVHRRARMRSRPVLTFVTSPARQQDGGTGGGERRYIVRRKRRPVGRRSSGATAAPPASGRLRPHRAAHPPGCRDLPRPRGRGHPGESLPDRGRLGRRTVPAARIYDPRLPHLSRQRSRWRTGCLLLWRAGLPAAGARRRREPAGGPGVVRPDRHRGRGCRDPCGGARRGVVGRRAGARCHHGRCRAGDGLPRRDRPAAALAAAAPPRPRARPVARRDPGRGAEPGAGPRGRRGGPDRGQRFGRPGPRRRPALRSPESRPSAAARSARSRSGSWRRWRSNPPPASGRSGARCWPASSPLRAISTVCRRICASWRATRRSTSDRASTCSTSAPASSPRRRSTSRRSPFRTAFARNLDYYTGFVFEARAADAMGGRGAGRRRPLRSPGPGARQRPPGPRGRRGDLDRSPGRAEPGR